MKHDGGAPLFFFHKPSQSAEIQSITFTHPQKIMAWPACGQIWHALLWWEN